MEGVAKDQNRSLLALSDRNSVLTADKPTLRLVGISSKRCAKPPFLRVSPSSGQNWKLPSARSLGHGATRSKEHAAHSGKPKFSSLTPLLSLKERNPHREASPCKNINTQKGPRAPQHARPFPYRTLLSAPRDYYPSHLGPRQYRTQSNLARPERN